MTNKLQMDGYYISDPDGKIVEYMGIPFSTIYNTDDVRSSPGNIMSTGWCALNEFLLALGNKAKRSDSAIMCTPIDNVLTGHKFGALVELKFYLCAGSHSRIHVDSSGAEISSPSPINIGGSNGRGVSYG